MAHTPANARVERFISHAAVLDRAGRPTVAELLDRYEAVIEPVLGWRRRRRLVPVRLQDVAGPFTFAYT